MVDNKIITITLVVVLGICLQVAMVFWDMQDTPNKAVVEFAKAFFGYDECMANRLCNDRRVINDVDVVKKYLYSASREATARGFGMFYMKNCLYNIQTHTIAKDHDKVQIRLTCERKPWLRAFFTGESPKKVDEIVELVKEKEKDGQEKWKVCGKKLFSLPEG